MASEDSELVEGDEEPLSVPDTSEVRLCNISTTHLCQHCTWCWSVAALAEPDCNCRSVKKTSVKKSWIKRIYCAGNAASSQNGVVKRL